jgi:hypothetical protein
MPIVRNWYVAAAVGIMALGAGGCVSQSAELRGTSADAHDQAAGMTSLAQDPRAVVRRMREMEQAACEDVPDVERDRGPLSPRERIAGVELLRHRPRSTETLQLAGVAIYLRGAPGMTDESLGRVLECHLAHRAVVGDRVADKDSPLFVQDARVAVSSAAGGFRIAITARDLDSARQIIQRATALVE